VFVDSMILRAHYGPSFPTPERGLHIRVDAHEDEGFTIDIGPRDEDGIRTVRITGEVVPTRADFAADTAEPGHRAPEAEIGD